MLYRRILNALYALWSAVLGVFTPRLRNQIVFPYLLLATALALAGTYVLMNAANQSLHDRFNAQLLDAARGGADSLAQAEIQQVAGLRAMAFTQGFSDAVVKLDVEETAKLIAPQAINYGFDRIMAVTTDTQTLLNLPKSAPNATSTPASTGELSALLDSALHPTGSQDKLSEVVELPDGARLLCTAGPVRHEGRVVGALLVGTDLTRLLKHVARNSLSDAASFYGPGGVSLGHTLIASGEHSPSAMTLPAGWYSQIRSDPMGAMRFRTVSVGDETYVEALGVVPGRGIGGGSPGVYGVMLRTRTLDAKLQQTLWTLVPVFGLALLLIIVIGRLLAAWIDRPVSQLVAASNYVAQGNLDVQVSANRKDELGLLASRFNEMVGGLRQLLFVKDLFGRFVSPEVSAKLLAGQIELGGEQRTVTTLFSDLREFTRLSEEHSPQEIVDLLNEYFTAIVRAARNHGGIINKFGGDSTLIVFGAPLHMEDHADRALATALEMRDAIDALNANRMKQGWEKLEQGIGINTGVVVAGQIGSEERMEYTVIGGAVNFSSRLQALTKDLPGCDVLFSETTLETLVHPTNWDFEDRGLVQIRGKKERMHIYSLAGIAALEERFQIRYDDNIVGKSIGHSAKP